MPITGDLGGNDVAQFSAQSAARMFADGLLEERAGVFASPLSADPQAPAGIQFTRMALRDWNFLADVLIPGQRFQYSEQLTEGLRLLGTGGFRRCFQSISQDGEWFAQPSSNLHWVIRRNGHRLVIHGISRAWPDPYRKAWRYLAQYKAVDLFSTNELYLRRIDLLDDKHEARPTGPMERTLTAALEATLGSASPDHLAGYEHTRRATFVSSWQAVEAESAKMWAIYCPEHDGCVVQSSERLLQHQFSNMCEGRRLIFYHDIAYVDHATFNPVSHAHGIQLFFKTKEFDFEQEVRFAWYRIDCIDGTREEIEPKLEALPDSLRLPFETDAAISQIVFNPAASQEKHLALRAMLASKAPRLVDRIGPSQLQS